MRGRHGIGVLSACDRLLFTSTHLDKVLNAVKAPNAAALLKATEYLKNQTALVDILENWCAWNGRKRGTGCVTEVRLSPGQTVLQSTQANSSQVAKLKLASAGGQTVPPSRANLQESIQLPEYDRVVT